MSNKVMNYVMEYSKQRGSALVVMFVLADMSNDDGECYPGKANLSKKCRVQERNLNQILNRLEADNELIIFHRRVGQMNQSNIYRIVMGGGDPTITRVVISRSPGGDPTITRGGDPTITRSLIFNPNESINDPEPSTNPIMEALKKRGELP